MSTLPKPQSLKSPSWRLDACLQGEVVEPSCPLISRLEDFVGGDGEEEDKELSEAYLLYYLPQSRAVLSSLLLAGADCPKIAGYIGSREEVVVLFSQMFFDISVFPNKLVIKDYVDSLPEDTSIRKNYKAMLRSGLCLGDRYVAWKMSLNIEDELSTEEAGQELFEDSYWRAREHKPFNIDDPRAKESKSWVPQVLRTMDSMASSQATGELSVDTLRLKLVKKDATFSRSELDGDIKG